MSDWFCAQSNANFNWTAATTSAAVYPTTISVIGNEPRQLAAPRHEGPLDWLRHQVEEITELAA